MLLVGHCCDLPFKPPLYARILGSGAWHLDSSQHMQSAVFSPSSAAPCLRCNARIHRE